MDVNFFSNKHATQQTRPDMSVHARWWDHDYRQCFRAYWSAFVCLRAVLPFLNFLILPSRRPVTPKNHRTIMKKTQWVQWPNYWIIWIRIQLTLWAHNVWISDHFYVIVIALTPSAVVWPRELLPHYCAF